MDYTHYSTKELTEELKDLEESMRDDYKSWKDAEDEVSNAIKWKNKMALNYANSSVKYYELVKYIDSKLVKNGLN